MRIPSGKTDVKIAFKAVDATDRVTPETGLNTFTVYRSRNGGTATAFTTPTIAEISSSNMPGMYVLTVDEDTTLESGVESHEMVLYITHSGMAPVARVVEIFRQDSDRTDGIETSLTERQAIRLMASVLLGTIANAGTGTETFKGAGVATTRAEFTVDSSGNRSAVSLTP